MGASFRMILHATGDVRLYSPPHQDPIWEGESVSQIFPKA